MLRLWHVGLWDEVEKEGGGEWKRRGERRGGSVSPK